MMMMMKNSWRVAAMLLGCLLFLDAAAVVKAQSPCCDKCSAQSNLCKEKSCPGLRGQQLDNCTKLHCYYPTRACNLGCIGHNSLCTHCLSEFDSCNSTCTNGGDPNSANACWLKKGRCLNTCVLGAPACRKCSAALNRCKAKCGGDAVPLCHNNCTKKTDTCFASCKICI